jgi:hypothetical protein
MDLRKNLGLLAQILYSSANILPTREAMNRGGQEYLLDRSRRIGDVRTLRRIGRKFTAAEIGGGYDNEQCGYAERREDVQNGRLLEID